MRLRELVDRLGIRHHGQRRIDETREAIDARFVDALCKEFHIVGTVFEQIPENVLQEIPGQSGIVVEIGKSNFGLDHPKLRQVTARIGVFGAERRTKRIDARQRRRIRLDVELTRNGQMRGFAKEILRIVDFALVVARNIGKIERRNFEHIARALAVTARDEWRMNPIKLAFVEELMNGHRKRVANASNGAKHIGSRAQMGDFAQKFGRMGLGLNRIRIGIFDPTDDFDRRRLHFVSLVLALRFDELTHHTYRTT